MQLLILHTGESPVTILSRGGLAQEDPLSMVLYGINLYPLAKEIRSADRVLLSPFYEDDAAFNGPERRSVQILKMLM